MEEVFRTLLEDIKQYIAEHYVVRKDDAFGTTLQSDDAFGTTLQSDDAFGTTLQLDDASCAAPQPAPAQSPADFTSKRKVAFFGAAKKTEAMADVLCECAVQTEVFDSDSAIDGGVYDVKFSADILESARSLAEQLNQLDESFGQILVHMIDERGMTDADCYHKAQLNRSHFNRIKNDPEYHVQKESVMALALALELNADEAAEFLKKAGYAFSPSSKADLIIRYCIEHGIYDVLQVNNLLYEFDQKLLGAGVRN